MSRILADEIEECKLRRSMTFIMGTHNGHRARSTTQLPMRVLIALFALCFNSHNVTGEKAHDEFLRAPTVERELVQREERDLVSGGEVKGEAGNGENVVEVINQNAELVIKRHKDEWDIQSKGGDVEIRVRDLTAYASRVRYRQNEGVVSLLPPVEGTATNLSFSVGELSYRIRERRWELRGGRMRIEPAFFPRGVSEPVHLKAAYGEGHENVALLKSALFSSCDKESPHWSLRADSVSIIADDKVIAKRVGIYLGERRLITLPTLTVSIKPRPRRTTLMPDVGRNEIEGWFFKYAHTYMADERFTGVGRFEWAEKRGIGLGIEQDYNLKAAIGALSLYWLRDRYRGTELNWSFRHSHRFSRSLTANLQYEVRSNSAYFVGRMRTSLLGASVRWGTKSMHTMFDMRRSSYSGYGETKDTYFSLRHSWQRERWSTNFVSTYRRFERGYFGFGGGMAPDEELQHKFELRHDGAAVNWMLAYEQRIDLDKARNTADAYFGLERLPEITVNFGLQRHGATRRGNIPLTFSLALGRFVEHPQDTKRVRLALASRLSQYQLKLSRQFNLAAMGQFEQCFYDDATAQYTYGMFAQLEWAFGRRSRMLLGYNLQKQHGYTPFRFDVRPPYESADLQLFIEPSERFQAALTTGLDIQNNIFRDITISTQWRMLNGFWWAASTGYDVERGQMRDIILWASVALPGRLLSKGRSNGYAPYASSYYGYGASYISAYSAYSRQPWREEELPPWGVRVNLSTRYSTIERKFALLRSFIDWRIGKAWRLQLLSSYNGIMRRMDYVQARLTRDLHCYELALTYNSLTREWRLEFNIKAFPEFRQFFGASDRSQLLDTSVGQIL
ncbi:MAG: hypothetical protein RMK18_01725 [Armatimonadota bacterium]|nr:hypothetical protein [Armatimonadota bacterium]MDW8024575.1 hypothetical protein [Armatimonadota bacterium]